MIKKLIDYYINPNNKLLGEDNRMYGYWEYNFIPVTFFFESDVPELDDIILKNAYNWFEDSESRIRAKLLPNKVNFDYYYESKEELIKKFIYKIEKLDNDII